MDLCRFKASFTSNSNMNGIAIKNLNPSTQKGICACVKDMAGQDTDDDFDSCIFRKLCITSSFEYYCIKVVPTMAVYPTAEYKTSGFQRCICFNSLLKLALTYFII